MLFEQDSQGNFCDDLNNINLDNSQHLFHGLSLNENHEIPSDYWNLNKKFPENTISTCQNTPSQNFQYIVVSPQFTQQTTSSASQQDDINESSSVFNRCFSKQSQNWTFEMQPDLVPPLYLEFTKAITIPVIGKKKINKLSKPKINSEVVCCQLCPRVFETKHQLGGHMSKQHKGMSETYKHKIAVRENRTLKRKSMKILQQHTEQRYQQAKLSL